MNQQDFTHLQDADTDRVSREMQRRWELEEQPLTKAEWDAFVAEVDKLYGVEPQQQEECLGCKHEGHTHIHRPDLPDLRTLAKGGVTLTLLYHKLENGSYGFDILGHPPILLDWGRFFLTDYLNFHIFNPP